MFFFIWFAQLKYIIFLCTAGITWDYIYVIGWIDCGNLFINGNNLKSFSALSRSSLLMLLLVVCVVQANNSCIGAQTRIPIKLFFMSSDIRKAEDLKSIVDIFERFDIKWNLMGGVCAEY